MKTSILTLTLAAVLYILPNSLKAQGKLEFNKVIYTDVPAAGNVPISVPAGKVWKIESAGCGVPASGTYIYLRNSSSQNVAILFLSGNPHEYKVALPYWLPESFTGSFQQSGNSSACSVSIIEFNVVP